MLSAAAVGQRQRIHVALAQARGDPRGFELDPRQPQHLRRAVDADRLRGARAEQFDHPPGAGADIDQPPERSLCRGCGRSRARLRFRRRGASGSGPTPRPGRRNSGWRPRRARRWTASVRRRRRRTSASVVVIGPAVDQREQRRHAIRLGKRQEYPAAFLAPLEHTGVGEDLQMARHSRLALAEHQRQFADRQLHPPQQREDAQPGGVGKRLEAVGEREASTSRDKDIKISLYGQFASASNNLL